MSQLRLFGIIPPTVTALNADESLDREGMARVVEYQIQGGVDALFMLGSNGEGPCLRDAVRRQAVEVAVEAARGRVPVIAGVIQPSAARVIEDMRLLAETGLQAYVSAPPYYFPGYNADDLVGYYRRLADASDLPILIYNIPQTTKVSVKAEVVLRLAEDPRIVGIKDSSGDWPEVQQIVFERPRPDFIVLQGNQQLSAVSLMIGADGLIPGFANAHPRLLADMYAAIVRGDYAEGLRCQAQLDTFLRVRGRAALHGTKLLLAHLGICQDHVTAPLPRMSPSESEQYLQVCLAAGFPSREPVGVRGFLSS
ncbi:MAG TPA: dihydrodipicolinate synthase family protein [Chloroflexota bacterium]|nr:dihydrodipicolinate synthase family protein [Chloroflexota bacterium]